MWKWLRVCWNFDHHRELAELAGRLAVAEADRAELRLRLNEREANLAKLYDWLLQINGAPTIHGTIDEPIEKKSMDPFHNVRHGRDFQRIAEELEQQAIGNQDLAMKR